MGFDKFPLSPEILKAISDMGFETPSPIQEQVIPVQLQGRDLIGQAQTGTGKTAAFGIPLVQTLLQNFSSQSKHCDALILTPTRELANQVAEELRRIAEHTPINVLPIYGGTPMEPQIRALRKKVNILVGTPGRVMDHLNRGTFRLDQIKTFILDEADEMLDMGFIDDIMTLVRGLPPERQMLLFSATMPPEIKKLATGHMNNPETLSASTDSMVVSKIDQVFYEIEDWERKEALIRVLDFQQAEMTIIFCQTKREVDELHRQLTQQQYKAIALHGDFSQHQRDQVMEQFRNNKIDILIATDLAARGIDVSHVTLVVNYTVPQNPEIYVHRIGRTGRAGRSGVAVTMTTRDDYKLLDSIRRITKTKLNFKDLPTREDLGPIRKEVMKHRLREHIADKSKNDFLEMAQTLLENASAEDILASALKLAFDAYNPVLKVDQKGQLNAENTGAERGMVRFHLNLGRNQQLTTGDLLRKITSSSKVPGDKVGKIRIQDDFTFLEIQEAFCQTFLTQMPKFTMNGVEVNVQPARISDRSFRSSNSGRNNRRPPSRNQAHYSGHRSSRRVSNG